jgi:hypothetical protein
MARVLLEVEFPDLTVQDLKEQVTLIDSIADEIPIAPENVTAAHVIALWASGEMDIEKEDILREEMTD